MEFFETKVIKVKKEKKEYKCEHPVVKFSYCQCTKCGKYVPMPLNPMLMTQRSKSKGNWVNGENLDKIKFPCLCSYSINTLDNPAEKQLGFIDYISIYGEKAKYILLNIGWQTKGCKLIPIFDSLENLIFSYHIHILKGKIIIFEEA